MAGNDHIPTAPADVIGDDGDLRQMRDALRAGKRVTLAHDGHVYIGTEAGAPMTEADEDFIESKLGHVIGMARQGYGVSISPDGSISADRADHRAKARYDNDPGFNEQDLILIRTGVQDGALIRLHTDGHVEYFLPKDAVKPTGAEAARLQQFIDDEIASGRLEQAWRNGETLAAQPDGSVVYQRVEDGPAPVEFPEEGAAAPRPMTADQLEEEARGLELGAGAARMITNEEYETSATEAAGLRDAAARQRATAEAAVKVAEAQLAEKQGVAARIAGEQADVARQAAEYRRAGDSVRAEELDEKLGRLDIERRIADREVGGAKAAADASRAEATLEARNEASFDARVRESWTTRTRNEDAQDSQEDQARVYRQAATEMREAERLDAAYADLRSRGVAGAERVQEAADQARARAESLRVRAERFDTQLDPRATDDALPREIRTNPGVFGDLSDATGAGGSDRLGTGTAATVDTDATAFDADIEMAAVATSGDEAFGAGSDELGSALAFEPVTDADADIAPADGIAAAAGLEAGPEFAAGPELEAEPGFDVLAQSEPFPAFAEPDLASSFDGTSEFADPAPVLDAFDGGADDAAFEG